MNPTANHLAHLADFQQVLKEYKISPEGQKALEHIKLVLLAAPTSIGRNTIIRGLLKGDDYRYVVSDTTRQPRINDGVPETNGTEYWFRDESEMLEDLKHGKFLEAAIIHNQQVSGISIRELDEARKQNKVAITDVEVVGVDTIVAAKPDTIAIFVLPPSFEEWQKRLHGRGQMPAEEVRRRMESAAKEFEAALSHSYYSFIINDTIPHAMEQIHELAVLEIANPIDQQNRRELAEQLYSETVAYLQAS